MTAIKVINFALTKYFTKLTFIKIVRPVFIDSTF